MGFKLLLAMLAGRSKDFESFSKLDFSENDCPFATWLTPQLPLSTVEQAVRQTVAVKYKRFEIFTWEPSFVALLIMSVFTSILYSSVRKRSNVSFDGKSGPYN